MGLQIAQLDPDRMNSHSLPRAIASQERLSY